MPTADVSGYLVYLLFIFLPGIGFGELLGVFKKVTILSEKIAIAFGLGISIDTVVMLVRTSKIDGLVGIDLETVYFVLAIGIVALLASLVLNKWKLSIISKPKGVDLALFLIILIQGGMLLLYFQKYPIFPQYQSQDFGNHVNYVLGLISGSITSIPQGLLYFGVHYQLASSYLLVGGEPLITLQRTIAILITLSPLLFYYAAKKIFNDNTKAGLITALIYTLSGSIWFNGPLDAGLYPNFFGILAALFVLISLLLLSASPRSIGYWALFILALINGYMSHYTFVTLLPAILILPLFQFITLARKSTFKKTIGPMILGSLIPALIAVLPIVIPFLIYPSVGRYALYLATSGGGVVTGSTYLSSGLSAFPFMKYLAIGVYDDLEFVVLILLAICCFFKGITSKTALIVVPVVWFLTLALAAPSSISAWRYSYEALVPLTLMASYAISTFLPNSIREGRASLGKRIKETNEGRSPLMSAIIVIILLGMILIGAYGQMLVSDALTSTSASAQSQKNVYDAIYWLKSNTPSNSEYLSVSDWRFTYSNTIIDRTTYYDIFSLPDTAISFAKNISAQYIIVTNLVTAKIANVPSLFPWNNFPTSSNSNLTLLYTNPDVRIYQIVSRAS